MTFLEERDFSNVPRIPDYFKGKTIFITGGSGFLGKVLIEKLLYSCPDLDRIYLLMRSKKGVAPENRLATIYSQACFDRLRNERPGLFESKIFYIAGDVSEKSLGMSEEDRTLIINRANIIFHVAASVRFDDSLKKAANLNVEGTIKMLELAAEVRNLECFIHVSTTYSNTKTDVIEEAMYPPLADWRETLDICSHLDSQTLQALTPKILGEIPNTYVFTKQLAEHVVYEQRGKLPIVITRPSIVISSIDEPIPGWIDNFNGPVGILVAGGKGILRVVYSDPDVRSDYVPVDVVVKGIITAAWARGTKKLESTDGIPIYNTCCGGLNDSSVQEIVNMGEELIVDVPFENTFRVPKITIEKSKFIYNLKVFLFHILPAIVFDILLFLCGKKPIVLKIQRRIYTANIALEYYATRQWKFNNTNFIELRSKIKDQDIEEFFYHFEDVDTYQYYKVCTAAARKYLLKEKDEDLDKAKAKFQRVQLVEKVVKFIFIGCVVLWIANTDFVKNYIKYIYLSL